MRPNCSPVEPRTSRSHSPSTNSRIRVPSTIHSFPVGSSDFERVITRCSALCIASGVRGSGRRSTIRPQYLLGRNRSVFEKSVSREIRTLARLDRSLPASHQRQNINLVRPPWRRPNLRQSECSCRESRDSRPALFSRVLTTRHEPCAHGQALSRRQYKLLCLRS